MLANTAKNTMTGIVTPEARPSMPSVRLTALTQPTMTSTAKNRYTIQLIWNVTFQNGM